MMWAGKLWGIGVAVAGIMFCADPAIAKYQQVYLIQNSGWMEPFYSDPEAKFRPLVRALIQASRLDDQEIVVAAFNQAGSVPGQPSPKVVYQGEGKATEVSSAIETIVLPRRPNGIFADTDFEGALNACFKDLLRQKSGLIWMVTNNKNDPHNSPDVISHTREFYRLLREHPGILRVIAYPIEMPARGRYFREGGLMIYGIAYGQTGNQALQRILAGEPMRKLFNDPPARLKPLGEESVRFEPKTVLTPGVEAKVQRGTLVIRGIGAEKGSKVVIKGRLHNDFFPQEIKSGRLSLHWQDFHGGLQAHELQNEISPSEVRDLRTGGVIENVRVGLAIPPIPSVWSADSLLRDGYEVKGVLRISLEDQQLALSPKFLDKMEHVFGLGQLPEIFRPDQAVTASNTLVPVRIIVGFPVWPLALAVTAAVLLLGGGVTTAILAGRERRYKLSVDGNDVTVSVKPFRKKPVLTTNGRQVAELKGALFGKPGVKRTDESSRIEFL